VRINLANAVADALAAEQSPEADAALGALAEGAGRSEWVRGAQLTLDDHAAAAMARITEALAEVDADDGRFDPLDADRAGSLDKVHALPCGRCDARLGCRVGLAGGRA
jgi:glutathione S-transferase